MISLITSIKLYFAIYSCNRHTREMLYTNYIYWNSWTGREGAQSRVSKLPDLLQQRSLNFTCRSHSSGALRDLLDTLQGLFSLNWLVFLNGGISVGLGKHNKWPSFPCKWRCPDWGQFFTTPLLWKREEKLQLQFFWKHSTQMQSVVSLLFFFLWV